MPASDSGLHIHHAHSTPTASTSDQILLIDQTRSPDEPPTEPTSDTEDPNPRKSDTALHRKWTRGSLQQQLARRKYAKWQEENIDNGQPESSEGGRKQEASDLEPETSVDDRTHEYGEGRLRRGRRKVKGLLGSKKERLKAANDHAEIDILYENQRGSFFFGIPLFSQNSLLNFDPKPWLNVHWKPSPVDITNAQVPDPSWEWAWKSWYVDMSHDVDEEGWEYSFSFQKGFSWHGTHPWFHSFVRRRRWLRKRVKKHTHHARATTTSGRRNEEAHMLNADYFTIHSHRSRSRESSRGTSLIRSSSASKLGAFSDDSASTEQIDIRDIGSLMRHLKRAAIDREKIVAVRTFMEQGGDELYYLAEQMPTIMTSFIFQNSRRQLLTTLLRTFDAASQHRAAHAQRGSPEDDDEKRAIDNLLNAVRAADEQVRRLEYWSDIRDMARRGETLGAADADAGWGEHEWSGLDSSGPASNERSTAKEAASAGPEHGGANAATLSDNAASGSGTKARDKDGDKAKRVAFHPDSDSDCDSDAAPHPAPPATERPTADSRPRAAAAEEQRKFLAEDKASKRADKGKGRAQSPQNRV
ncbi:hypothetical protein B0A49_06003 [Cryomyces minteri]|uniref:Peroxin/Ferlin domain-containing protein n=1 Tax=Cryomyces minteri TaxID=331657 RepID=A0A4U0X6K1_9PEZI|nr:hypothetical protein B0A49_06003 [Cryomyces minteri]